MLQMVISSMEIPDERPGELPGPPPLRLSHIFLITAVIAVMLTAHRTLVASNEVGSLSALASVWTILDFVTSGMALTLTGLGIFWRRPGWSLFQQPGHWLLALTPLSLLLNSLWNSYYLNGDAWWILTFLLPIPGTAELILLLAAAWKGFGSIWWRIFFSAQVVFNSIPFITPLSADNRLVYGFVYFVTLLTAIALATLIDIRTSRRRDWLQWAGVAITAFNLMKGLAIYALTAIGA
jgi:hypothetical protein